MQCNREIKTASGISTNRAMLILPFWQTSSINNNLLTEPSHICGAEKVWMKAKK